DRIDGAHSEEDAGALVKVSCYVITATRPTLKALVRHRKRGAESGWLPETRWKKLKHSRSEPEEAYGQIRGRSED
ncbi:hypothetical protein MTO96_042739, partial [Rhipicephalus appendiculatus]